MSQANLELKTKLLSQIEILGKERSLLPFSERSIDETIKNLEKINPIPQPLLPKNLSSLVGDWQLIYASNGIVITRPIAEMANLLGSGIKINSIGQSVHNFEGKILASNRASIELPLLGEYELLAEGVWQAQPDNQTAKVSFAFFSLQAIKFLSQLNWILPEIQIPIGEFFSNEALWITSYLDEDMRIGRGVTGNLFVFRLVTSSYAKLSGSERTFAL